MSETNQAKRDETVAKLLPAMRRMTPQLMELGEAYHKAYPPKETAPEVLNAVTVPVPLQLFMVMAALCTSFVAAEVERERGQAAKADA